jgi:nitrite reductase/ring-hydroxylating ferredoxin subunit
MVEPHPYPNGWYHVADEEELSPGVALPVTLCDARLVLFRCNDTGEISALDEHCAHLGASLAGGRVRAGCVTCPFHGWQYGSDGRVREIPYAKRVPPRLGVRAFPVRAIDGHVFVWYAPHGGARKPAYEIEAHPGIADRTMRLGGTHDGGVVTMTVFDFAENGPDLQHFAVVHRRMRLPWTRIALPGVEACVRPRWHIDAARPHVAWLHVWGTFSLLGRVVERAAATASVEFIGPGSVARFHFERPGLGRVVLYHTHTPVGAHAVRVRLRWYRDASMPRALAWYLVGNWVSQWSDDVAIWERKRFAPKPMLVAEDGPVLEMRRWYRQFYGTEASETNRTGTG